MTMADDWKHYVIHRPSYPDSMWEILTRYHHGPLTKVHDIGAGSGNAVDGLLSHIKDPVTHVVVSDPLPKCALEQCTRFEGRFPDTTFSYRTARGEDEWDSPLGLDQVDFVISCESLYWTNLEPTLANTAKSLRPEGTFAAVIYSPFPIIKNNEAANAALRSYIVRHVENLTSKGLMTEEWKQYARQLFYGFDCVSLPDGAWKDVKRIHINIRDNGWLHKDFHPAHLRADFERHSLPVLGPYEHIAIDDDPDWQKLSTSLDWFQGMLESFRFGGESSWKYPEWAQFQAAVEERGNGQLDLEWQVQMILARKRG